MFGVFHRLLILMSYSIGYRCSGNQNLFGFLIRTSPSTSIDCNPLVPWHISRLMKRGSLSSSDDSLHEIIRIRDHLGLVYCLIHSLLLASISSTRSQGIRRSVIDCSMINLQESCNVVFLYQSYWVVLLYSRVKTNYFGKEMIESWWMPISWKDVILSSMTLKSQLICG
jgi:hypothetical protein